MRLVDKKGKRVDFIVRRLRLDHKKEQRAAARKKYLKRKRRVSKHPPDPLSPYMVLRNNVRKKLYKQVKYKEPAQSVNINDDFGIEKNVDSFLTVAETFMSFKSKSLFFNLYDCNKIWPTGITLLCSLAQWVELTSYPNKRPTIGSSYSNNEKVNSYLNHCGFYDYVNRQKELVPDYYPESEIVKIKRELDPSSLEPREMQIVELLKKHSSFNEDQIEEFDDVVLTEIFNNVSEHGINNRDRGWWTLSQSHKTAKIISVCIADNGIGIKNNLITGPQREGIIKNLAEDKENDGEFIRLAIEENVSGAFKASVKSGRIFTTYERGSRRGHGLKRITKTCKKLGISIVILSQKGYAVIDKNGQIIKVGTKPNRIFAGTLYHLQIPAKNSDN